ncbi:hypothetical protein QF028_004375 [Neobacillus sp. B4I6]|uniref:hypothetical protein n=1 Tax=Neobacillus sp. B4I6 TaxID=3373925 RepID=UPI003D1FD95F
MSKTQKEVEKELLSDRDAILAQPKVKLFIPHDRSNPAKHRTVIINGQEFILAVGKQLEVPEVVAEVWNDSYSRTVEAEFNMEKFNEV